MQCFICMTYMFLISTGRPYSLLAAPNHDVVVRSSSDVTSQPRSLFHDVIESLRIRAQLPDDHLVSQDNNLAQNYERYGYENEPQLPSDADFIPRRNDRIEMPSLKYRYPKSLNVTSDDPNTPKEEIIVYIDTTNEPKTTTQKPKKQKRPGPPVYKKPSKKDEDAQTTVPFYPSSNTMGGQSQIGNRESQLVVKPTVIVNLRGTVSHRDSDIRIEGRNHNETFEEIPYNVFNINQKIQLERTFGSQGSSGVKKEPVKEEGKCDVRNEVSTENRKEKKFDNVFEFWFNLPNLGQ